MKLYENRWHLTIFTFFTYFLKLITKTGFYPFKKNKDPVPLGSQILLFKKALEFGSVQKEKNSLESRFNQQKKRIH